jgi:hypothetical protein
MTSEFWWVDETLWPGPKSTSTLYHAFPKGPVNIGDLYLNSLGPDPILYRMQLKHKGHVEHGVEFEDWEMVARGIEEVDRYLDEYGI